MLWCGQYSSLTKVPISIPGRHLLKTQIVVDIRDIDNYGFNRVQPFLISARSLIKFINTQYSSLCPQCCCEGCMLNFYSYHTIVYLTDLFLSTLFMSAQTIHTDESFHLSLTAVGVSIALLLPLAGRSVRIPDRVRQGHGHPQLAVVL